VLYPVGARTQLQDSTGATSEHKAFLVGYAGTLSGGYGKMIQQLVRRSAQSAAGIEFRIWGANPDWSAEFNNNARENGIYLGQVPFQELIAGIQTVDCLLLPMCFEADRAQVEKTSFKTKYLDYLSYQKPIIVWGPEYCSAVRVAREFDSAQICTEESASAALMALTNLREAPQRRRELVGNAQRMYEDRFNPDKIHQGFVAKLRTVAALRRN
jgi:hypothetical protein